MKSKETKLKSKIKNLVREARIMKSAGGCIAPHKSQMRLIKTALINERQRRLNADEDCTKVNEAISKLQEMRESIE